MLQQLRAMPVGVRLFLGYALAMLALIGLTLPLVVKEAIEAPVSFVGLIDMLLLAYLVFTLTLVLQRKQAAYPLAIGLATLALTLVPILSLSPVGGLPAAIVALVVAMTVIAGLRRRSSRSWFVEP
jgi:hypothetical protein